MTKNAQVFKKVFVSYVRDNADEIDRICKIFSNNKIEYWLDRVQVEPGKLWKKAIRDAINNGAFFLACFSREYENRSETFMNEELFVAIDILRTKPYNSGWLIPIKLSECEIPAIDIGANHTLQDIQYLEFHKDWENSIKRLIDMILRPKKDREDLGGAEFWDKIIDYQAFKSLIENGDGVGFHNADLGHPVYFAGAMGEFQDMWEYADSPNKNSLFKKLSKLSKDLKEMGIEDFHFRWWFDFSEWNNFCKFAIDIYNCRKELSK